MNENAFPWIRSRRWDLAWLIGTALIVPAGLLFVWSGAPADWVNLIVTGLVGGPHLFATFLTTYFNPGFRRGHAWFLAAVSILVPALVLFLTLTNFQLLLSVFVFSASLHVFHQHAFIADVYRRRSGLLQPASYRALDYFVLGLAFYPIASSKLVRGDFAMGDVAILVPSFLLHEALVWSVFAAFGIACALWIAKTAVEWRRGELNVPKTALIGTAATIAFLIPLAERGERMELSFQCVNAWHSLQYLALVWLSLNTAQVGTASQPRWTSARFYGLCLAATAGIFGFVFGLQAVDPFSLGASQYYEVTSPF
jgi:hypothetical protein